MSASDTTTSTTSRPSLARDSGRAVVGSVVSNACNVLVILVLARFLGGEQVGEYTIAFAMRALLLLGCGLGMRVALTKFVAAHLARSEPNIVRGAVRAGILAPLALACLTSAVWFALAGTLANDVFYDADLTRPLELFALSLPFYAVTDLALAATQGFQTMRAYVWVGQVLEPVTRFGLTFLVLLAGEGIVAASGALLVASMVSAAAAFVALVRMLATLPGTDSTTPWRELLSFGGTSWVASMATQGLLWADVVILGILVTSEEVGAYQVAARVVLIGMFVITPLTASMAPRVAYLWAQHDRAGVTDRYVAVVLWSTRLSLPALAGVVAVPAAVLSVFGPTFEGAVGVVLVLTAGAVAEAIGAPSAVLLNQIGRNRLNMVVNVSQLALNISLNLVLVPLWGIEGAATAWAVTLVLGALVRIVAVRRVATARWPFSRELVVALVAGVLAAAVAASGARLTPDVAPVRLLVAALLIASVYLGVVMLAGLSVAERSSLRREVSLKVPALRRWRVQWKLRQAGRSTDDLLIDGLVSPFRLDVLARAELFTTAREHADLRRDDPEEFMQRVRQGRYGTWFDTILVPRGHVSAEPQQAERQFRQIVSASLQLLDRHDRSGGSALGKVSVVRVPAGTELDGWSLGRDRWVLLDGGHRVALALLDGRTTLAPADYVVESSATLPPNNTVAFLRAGAYSADEVVSFLARGMDVPDATTWADLLDGLEPAERAALAAWPEEDLLAPSVSPS